MMGKALTTTNVAITKGTSGVLLMRQEESARKEYRNCIRCTKCVTVCPMGLEPYYLMLLGEHNKLEALEAEKVMDCIECGLCTYICPSRLDVTENVRRAKRQLMLAKK